jgi:hypothetical protein
LVSLWVAEVEEAFLVEAERVLRVCRPAVRVMMTQSAHSASFIRSAAD